MRLQVLSNLLWATCHWPSLLSYRGSRIRCTGSVFVVSHSREVHSLARSTLRAHRDGRAWNVRHCFLPFSDGHLILVIRPLSVIKTLKLKQKLGSTNSIPKTHPIERIDEGWHYTCVPSMCSARACKLLFWQFAAVLRECFTHTSNLSARLPSVNSIRKNRVLDPVSTTPTSGNAHAIARCASALIK